MKRKETDFYFYFSNITQFLLAIIQFFLFFIRNNKFSRKQIRRVLVVPKTTLGQILPIVFPINSQNRIFSRNFVIVSMSWAIKN